MAFHNINSTIVKYYVLRTIEAYLLNRDFYYSSPLST